MSRRIKPNCRKCYYSSCYIHSEKLAGCKCEDIDEPTVLAEDKTFGDTLCVKRNEWAEECECEHFMPRLNELEGDFELEAHTSFDTSFECPFCGADIDIFDIGIEETVICTCDECGRKIAVDGKAI